MILSPTVASGKPSMPIRLRPLNREGLQILFKTKSLGMSSTKLSKVLNVHPSNISHVIHGRRRSARIESEIAKIFGKASWNDVVLEARSEVQGKPVKVILREMEQKAKAAREDSEKRMADYIARNSERVIQTIPNKKTAKERRRA